MSWLLYEMILIFLALFRLGDKQKDLAAAAAKFPMDILYDDSLLAVKLSIDRVPIKIYLEDGVIKKVWGGASIDENKRAEFVSWLNCI